MSERHFRLPSNTLKILTQGGYLVITIIVLFSLSFLLGNSILNGRLNGNDSPMHVAYCIWLDQYFPDVPHWFPLQGGGVSLAHGYPILPHLLVVVFHRITGLSIIQIFRLISFLAFPFTALGIYILCWGLWNKQSIGFIAAIFYLLAPVTWTWMYDWGFFASHVALVFLPLAILLFDLTLKSYINEQRRGRRRLWVAAFVIILLLTSLLHMMVGAAAVAAMILYLLFRSITTPKKDRSIIISSGIKLLFHLSLIGGLLVAGYLVPFYKYTGIANREGLNTPSPEQLNRLPIKEFFGISPIDSTQVLTRMQFPIAVTICAIVGALLALLYMKNRLPEAIKVLPWVLVASVATVYTLTPALVAIVLKTSSLLVMFFNFRSMLFLAMILMPMVAGFGIWITAHSILYPEAIFRRHQIIRNDSNGLKSTVRPILVSLLSLLIAIGCILFAINNLPIGPSWFDNTTLSEMIDRLNIEHQDVNIICASSVLDSLMTALCNVSEARTRLILEFQRECDQLDSQELEIIALCNDDSPTYTEVRSFIDQCAISDVHQSSWQLCSTLVKNPIKKIPSEVWRSFLSSDEDTSATVSQEIASALSNEQIIRFSVSPYHGRLAQDFSLYSGASQIDTYSFQLSLIHLMWGQQLGSYYSNEYGSPNALVDIANWMGIHYVFLEPKKDPIEKYETSIWELVYEGVYGSKDLQVWRYPEAPPMATASTKPTILVIGTNVFAYADVFRLANEGLAPYTEFTLVEGREQVDLYTLEELQRFDMLLLHGYNYKNSRRAWRLLDEYVQQGGSLFIDTGWQYVVPEWEFTKAPEVLPVSRLTWTHYGQENNYDLENTDIIDSVDPVQFGPMVWEEDPWGVSGATREDLRDWGKIILSYQGHPLIVAGEYHKGRVIWSGMNFISHLIAYENEEELYFLNNLLNWLSEGYESAELVPPSISRDHPDYVRLFLSAMPGDVTWLFWREAYYPNWHAYLNDDAGEREIPIYRGGPGFMLMPIETSSGEVAVTLRWESSFIESASIIISILGVLFLFGIAIDGIFLSGQGLTWIKIAFTTRLPRPILDEKTHQEAHKKPLRVKEIPPDGHQADSAGGDDTLAPNAFEGPLSDEQESLLKSWLDDKNDEGDSWVNKMLDPDQRK